MTERDRLAALLLTTIAGKRLLAYVNAPIREEPPWEEVIAAIEAEAREQDPVCAEAVAAERARLAKAVRGLEGYDALWDGGDLCARAAVLAIVEKP